MYARPIVLPPAEPNLTPMIDVLLVLIIVFMVMVVQVYHTVDVQLPDACQGTCGTGDQIVLEVLPGPSYRLNRAVVAPSDLLARLTMVYRTRPEKVIQIAGHPGARYDDVITAMDIAKSAGVRVIGVAPKAAYLPR